MPSTGSRIPARRAPNSPRPLRIIDVLKSRELGFLIAALAWAGLSLAHLRVVPGEWRMSAYTPAGVLHYSTCLHGHHFAAQILSQEGQHCRLSNPIVIAGAAVTVREECRMPGPGGQGLVRARLVARLLVQPSGLGFSGTSRVTFATSFGDISEHQRLSGVRIGRCRRR